MNEQNPAFESVWGDLKSIYNNRLDARPWYDSKLTEADLKRWANQMNISDDIMLEKIAIRLAQGYHIHELDFTFCDAVINDMFATDIGRSCQPNLFWQVFLAFDAGEAYYQDKRDEDPAEVYTRPLIAEIIESIKTS